MRGLVGTGVLMCALAGPALAAASAVEFKPRAEAWHLTYDDNSCDLGAAFGEGKARTLVNFTRFGPAANFTLSLYSGSLRQTGVRSSVVVEFGPDVSRQQVESINGTFGKDLPFVTISNLRLDGWKPGPKDKPSYTPDPPIAPADEARVETMTVVIAGTKRLGFRFGPMAQPLRAFRECTSNLVKAWGYDPQTQAALTRPAIPRDDPRNWVRSSDYPVGYLVMGLSSIVRFRLDVDETGAVTGCHIMQAMRPAGFGEESCRALRMRAAFTPALDRDGKPTKDFFISTVLWINKG